MGDIFSCCCPQDKEPEPLSERSRLLANNNNSIGNLNLNRIVDANVWQRNRCSSTTSMADPLTNGTIVDKMHSNNNWDKIMDKMIDISALDQPIDRMEWKQRQEIYAKRVQTISRPLILKSKLKSSYLTQGPILDKPFEPISEEDMNLINDLSAKASEAVLKGFKIHSEESILVQFNP